MARGKVILVAGVAVLAVLWSGAWYGGRYVAAGVLDRSAANASAGLVGADCSERSIGGFPLRLSVACNKTTVVAPAGVRAEVAGFSANAPLYQPGRVDAVLASPATLEAPREGVTANLNFQAATGSANLWLNGASRLAGSVEQMELGLDARQALPVKRVALGRGQAEIVGSSRTADSLDVNLDLAGLDVVRASGTALPRVDLKGTATLVGAGSALRQDANEQMAAWLAAGGKLHLENFALSAAQTSVETTGDLTVDEAGKVSGKLRLRLVGIAGLPDLLEQVVPGSKSKATQAVAVLGALTRLVQTDRGPAQEVEVSLNGGVMMVGILPIAVIPPLF